MFRKCQTQWSEGNATNIDLSVDGIASYCSAPLGLCRSPYVFFLLSFSIFSSYPHYTLVVIPLEVTCGDCSCPAARHPPSRSLISHPQQYKKEGRERKSRKNHGQVKDSLISEGKREEKKKCKGNNSSPPLSRLMHSQSMSNNYLGTQKP